MADNRLIGDGFMQPQDLLLQIGNAAVIDDGVVKVPELQPTF